MVEKIDIARLVIFGYLNFIPVLTNQWSAVILPLILRNNLRIADESRYTLIAVYFFISFFIGINIGCFLWPWLVNRMTKRNCVLLSVVIMGVANAASGLYMNIFYICAWRTIAGAALNLHTVGKDFLFEFCHDDHYRQFGLTLDSCFALIGNIMGPFIGYQIYIHSGDSFTRSCLVIGLLFLIGLVSFLTAFFFDYEIKVNSISDDEEKKLVLRLRTASMGTQVMQSTQYKDVFIEAFRTTTVRNLIILFMIATTCTNCDLILSVFYLQTAWEDEGLGVTAGALSYVSFIAFFPALAVISLSPRLVPKSISYKRFIQVVILIFSAAVIVTPLFRDLIPSASREGYMWLVYANQLVKYCSSSHVISPFIHYLLNKKANEFIRTSLNSINYIFCTLSLVVLMNLIVPLLSVSLFCKSWQRFQPFNKCLTFWIVGALSLSALCFLPKPNKRLKRYSILPNIGLTDPVDSVI
jgi:MFS family permease